MKQRFSILIASLGISLCASAQTVNPRIDSLFSQLKALDCRVDMVREGLGKNSRIVYYANLYFSPNMYGDSSHWADSMVAAGKTRHEAQLRVVRTALDNLCETASECYHYKYHHEGKDTLLYSINLSPNSADRHYRQDNMTYVNSDESVSFSYTPLTNGILGYLRYELMLNDTVPENEANQYPLDALERDVLSVFKRAKLKGRKAHWLHDKAYSDSVYSFALSLGDYSTIGKVQTEEGTFCDGETDLQIFSIPSKYKMDDGTDTEPLAMNILNELDIIARRFTESHPSFSYIYNISPTKSFYEVSRGPWKTLLKAHTSQKDDLNRYMIVYGYTYDAFHFAIVHHHGALWAPHEWTSIQSFVNGKKTYFKGMEPKQ